MTTELITAENLQRMGVPALAARRALWPGMLPCYMTQHEIDSPLRCAHFLAQIFHESRYLTAIQENLNYSADRLMQVWPSRFTPELAKQLARNPEAIANHVYGGRMGNTQPGDGWKYRGRGYTMLTGAHNYRAFAEFIGDNDIIDHPELVETKYAAAAAVWFWTHRKINAAADRNDLEAVTRLVNGGLIGLADRRAKLKRALAILK